MEIRVLEYFLAVAREQSISGAAEFLHLTQPTISRQLKELEDEFGKRLFIRGSRKMILTEDGAYFRKKAEEIVTLAHRTEAEMKNTSGAVAGDVYIGTGESASVRKLLGVARSIQSEFPDVHFHLTSGDTADLIDRLDKGLFDCCVLFGDIDQSKYDYISLPYSERWGLLMRTDAPLCGRERICTEDLWDIPLIMPRQSMTNPKFFKWLGRSADGLNILNTYNLAYNGALMVEESMGYMITLEKLVNTHGTDLSFKLIYPEQSLSLTVVWKKYKALSKTLELFIDRLERLTA